MSPALGDFAAHIPILRFGQLHRGEGHFAMEAAPVLGAHNDEVYAGLGLTPAEIAELRAGGVI